ncbi:hypothetical protein HMPREF9374_2981 [Desmospora sp. 8437]|nr:hypothetical protein HMPREF9374_2981 [Desmospora sp. 8437]
MKFTGTTGQGVTGQGKMDQPVPQCKRYPGSVVKTSEKGWGFVWSDFGSQEQRNAM